MRSTPSRPRTAASGAALAVALAALLAACGGGSTSSPATKTSSGTAATGAGAGTAGGTAPGSRRGFPGVVGSVAAITGSSMEVQNPSSGQTTVSWTASTTFAQTVTLAASSVAAGDCATVVGTSSGGRITARTVAVSTAQASGTCAPRFGAGDRGFGGVRQGGRSNGTGPNGAATRRGFPAGGGARFSGTFASGKVVSSSATSLVLLGTSFSGGRPPGSAPPTTAAPSDITVTVEPSTVFTEVRPTTPASLAVGDCVVANGPAASTGAVSAHSVRITSTGGQSCTAGFGRFGGGGSGSPSASSNG